MSEVRTITEQQLFEVTHRALTAAYDVNADYAMDVFGVNVAKVATQAAWELFSDRKTIQMPA